MNWPHAVHVGCCRVHELGSKEGCCMHVNGPPKDWLLDATLPELLAIKEVLSMFSSLRWSSLYFLIVETDCSVCVDWINRPCTAPSVHEGIIYDCLTLCYGFSWPLQSILRGANATADLLAKKGASRLTPMVWSCDS
ncbi:hypothetical protein V6N13_043487 [Hibiscus sabdariffa]